MNRAILEIALLLFLLLLAAVTAASEISLIAVSRLRLRKAAMEGSKSAKLVLKILETPEKFLGTILVTNNIIDTLIASIMTAIMLSLIADEGKGIIIATAIATFLIIVFEVTAKTLATRHSKRMSLLLARPIKALIFLFSPLVRIFAFITNSIVRLLGSKSEWKRSIVTAEDIKTLIKIGEEEDVAHREEYKMLSRAADFADIVVKNAMTSRKEMVLIDINASFEDILDKAVESGYSRFPVYKDNPENIIGVINMKDLLNLSLNKGLVLLQDIVYPAIFIPNSKKVSELLREFQKGHTHLAIVKDPDGRIEGLITLEDLLEEIVGDIEDEYDLRAK